MSLPRLTPDSPSSAVFGKTAGMNRYLIITAFIAAAVLALGLGAGYSGAFDTLRLDPKAARVSQEKRLPDAAHAKENGRAVSREMDRDISVTGGNEENAQGSRPGETAAQKA